MDRSRIVIGTRGSALALEQTELIRAALHSVDSALTIDIQIITTQGDTDLRPIPTDEIGKGWFSKEIERGLQTGDIDIAVHSLKDLPEQLAEGLIIGAITERDDARDVLVLKQHQSLEDLPSGSIIGTDSARRKVQLLSLRPDLVVESIRGNVPTRLEKMKHGKYDGLMLAAAGLHRLGLKKEITQYFDTEIVTPSPGQGALAVELKAGNKELAMLVARIHHAATDREVRAERAFSKAIGGGCKKPVGAYAISKGNTLHVSGMLGFGNIVRGSLSGSLDEPEELGKKLAEQLLGQVSSKEVPST